MLIHYLTTALVAVLAAESLTAFHAFAKRKAFWEKAAILLFGALFLVAYLWDGDAIASVYHLAPMEGVSIGTLPAFLLVWFTTAAALFLCLFPFFRKACPAMGYYAVFALLVFGADAVLLPNYIAAHTGAFEVASARTALLAAEVGFGLGASCYALFVSAKHFKKEAKKLGWILLGLLGMLLCSAPNYTLQLLFNPADYAFTVIDLNFYHRLFLYPAIVIPVVLWFFLSGKPLETKRCAVLFYALSGLWNFMCTQKFPMIWGLEHVGNLPLHLCNTACYVTPLCLTFKWKRLFYFTYFINVFGAFLALTMPNYSIEGLNGTVLVYSTLHFYRAHYQAFFMPLLIVGLGIFERPRLRQFIYSMVAFFFYYILMLVLNGWFTNYDAGVDYFFINSDFIADKLGTWAERLRDIVVSFSFSGLTFTYYPLYQSLYFLVYCLLALAMWFLYEVAYRSVSGWLDLAARRKKIRMDALALAANAPHDGGAPMNQSAETLTLKGFPSATAGAMSMPQRMSTSKCAGERSSASSGPTVRANPPSSRASSASSPSRRAVSMSAVTTSRSRAFRPRATSASCPITTPSMKN